MKKEFSFYEFVALIVPSCVLLFGGYLLLKFYKQFEIIDFSKLGETIIFIIVCYGVGHLIQSLGNLFEKLIWFVYGGMPTMWLSKPNRFKKTLFEQQLNQDILQKVQSKFGNKYNDYGRLTYNLIFQAEKTGRIDIFNGNYSLFRGLSVSFILLAGMVCYYSNWQYSLLSFIPFVLLTRRMIRFGKYYATEIFLTFYNL